MNMEGEQQIVAPLQKVWEALNDPDVLRASIPGCQSLEKEADDRFSAVVEIKVGPIGARFKGVVTLTDLNPPNGYTLILEGNGGIAGSAQGNARVQLSEQNGDTLVSYVVDAQVGGRMAQLGGPIIDATAKQLASKFFSRFGEIVSGVGPERAAPATAETTATPHVTAAGVAPAAKKGLPITMTLAIVVVALVGFLVGRSQGVGDGDWAGLAIGLLLALVAAAAFEYGRRVSAPTIVLDNTSLRRLLDGERS